MKKTAILALMLAFTAVLPAYGNAPAAENGGTDTTVNLIDKYTAPSDDPPEIPENFVIPEGYTYEMEYRYFPDGDNNDGITYMAATMEIHGDRMYYSRKAGLSYLDLKTGESYTLCPDPLCDHTLEDGCQFLGLNVPMHHPKKDNIIFALQRFTSGMLQRENICVIDEKNATITKVYGSDVKGSELGGAIFFNLMAGDKLYFQSQTPKTTTDEAGNVDTKVVTKYYSLDINTYEVEEINKKISGAYIASDKHILFIDNSIGRVMVTDLDFENEKVVMEYDPDGLAVWNYCYDSVTDEFYFNMVSAVLLGNEYEGRDDGYLYRIDKDLNCEKINISDKVINFSLTRDYIYFTKYEPIELGETVVGGRCAVVNGGNFYRMKRDDTGEVELVFDGGVELNHMIYDPFYVFGDYMYYLWAYIVEQEGGAIHFKMAQDCLRVGFTDNTVKSLGLARS